MKSIIPDPHQLDELAAGLDAGWDEEPAQASPSQPPHSAPLPAALEALDDEWDVAAAPAPERAAGRSSSARSNQARPLPARAGASAGANGAVPLRISKQERRETERKRRAQQALQKSVTKKERKAERQAEARLASEQLRLAEQQAIAERRARQGAGRQRKPAKPEPAGEAQAPVRKSKRAQREQTTNAQPAQAALATKRKAPPLPAPVVERAASKLLPLVAIAIVFTLCAWFALSRAR